MTAEPNPPLDHEEYIEYMGDDWLTGYSEWGDDYEDELENAIDNCGLDDNGDCLEAGTEHCSFFCPFRHNT